MIVLDHKHNQFNKKIIAKMKTKVKKKDEEIQLSFSQVDQGARLTNFCHLWLITYPYKSLKSFLNKIKF